MMLEYNLNLSAAYNEQIQKKWISSSTKDLQKWHSLSQLQYLGIFQFLGEQRSLTFTCILFNIFLSMKIGFENAVSS